MKKLIWKKLVIPGQKALVSRIALCGAKEILPHTHDFPEVFWMEKGSLAYEMNGRTTVIGPHALVMVKPARDAHGYKTVEGRQTVFLNVAFAPEVLRYFMRRYFPGKADFWGTSDSEMTVIAMSELQIKFLSSAAERLAEAVSSCFETDFFIFNLLKELGFRETPFDFRHCPEWLAEACRRMREPENFAKGVPRLNKLAGRTPEHVARVLKSSTGQTPGKMVNAYRLEYASVQLRMTDKEIAEIACECGFESLSHFYRVFRKHFKSSPGKYRNHHCYLK